MGHRRYFYGGHAKTIKPDKRKLALLFDRPDIRYNAVKLSFHFSVLISEFYKWPFSNYAIKEYGTEEKCANTLHPVLSHMSQC